MVPANALIDLAPGIGQVSAMVRYRVVSEVNEIIGELPVLEHSSVNVDVDATNKRSLRDILVRDSDLSFVNLYVDRLQPTYIYEDGSEWPCGMFYFVDDRLLDDPATSRRGLVLLDGDSLLDDTFTSTFNVPPYGSLTAAANEIADQCGILWRSIPDSGAAIGDPMVWPADTPRKRALAAICAAAGWLPPYFDNRGWLIIRDIPDLARAEPDHIYSPDSGRVLRQTVVRKSNRLSAPNRHVVTNNGPVDGEITAEASVDPSQPYSREQRRRTITQYHDMQGVGSTAHAQAIANRFAAVDPATFLVVEFVSTPDPRHDLFQIVQWEGQNMRESQWSLPLSPGTDVEMRHLLTLGGFSNG